MGTHTTRFYLASHAVLLPAIVAAGVLPWRAPQTPRHLEFAAVSAAAFVGNSVFHVLASLRWREYSPGTASAVTLVAPSAIATLRQVRRDGLRGARFAAAAALGSALNLAVVGSLWLDMPRLGGAIGGPIDSNAD